VPPIGAPQTSASAAAAPGPFAAVATAQPDERLAALEAALAQHAKEGQALAARHAELQSRVGELSST